VLFAFNEFVFDATRHRLSRAGTPLKVESQVLDLLGYLLQHPGRVVSKAELSAEVWQGRSLAKNVISVCVAKLRRVLGGPSNCYVRASYGRGYRFVATVRTGDEVGPPTSPSPVPTAAPVSASAFVGRSTAVARLHAALARARKGRGLGCAVLGEAGIGKTRLAEHLAEQAATLGFRVSWGHCHALGGAPPLWPWLQIVRSTYAELPPELAALPADTIAQASDLEGDAARELSNPSELCGGGSWHKTLMFMTDVIARTSRAQPWVVVFEDAQWADAASLQLLAHLAVEVAHLPLLMVITVRDTELPSDPRSRRALDFVLGRRDWERIELPRLGLGDVAAYATELFGEAPQDLVDAVFSKSEGNPFFMVELLRPWSDGRAPALRDLRVSGASLEIVRAVIDRLDAGARQVLSAAAVVGRSWDLGLIAAVTDHPHQALLEILEQAFKTHVIVAAPDNHTHFVFGHDLIRSVLYDDLTTIARVRLHHRVAEALLARRATAGVRGSAELAHHLLSALPYGDVMFAVTNARHAAAAARRVGAHADAAAFLRRALDALRLQPEEDAQTTCALLYELANCERCAGDPSFERHFEEAARLAQQHRLGDILAAVGQLMSDSPGMVALEGAADVLAAALEVLPESARALKAIVLAQLSWTSPNCNDAQRAATLLAAAQNMAPEGSGPAQRAVLRARLYYAGGPDDHAAASAIASEMARLVSRGSRQRARGSIESELAHAVSLLQRGELAQAERAVLDFGAAAHELQHAELIWHYDRMRVVLRMNRGDFAYARVGLHELHKRALKLNLYGRRAVEVVDWGQMLHQTGSMTPTPAELVRRLRAEPSDCPSVRAAKLRILAQFGLLDEARETLQALPIAELYLLPKSRDYLATLGHLAFTSVATGSLEHCAALYELLQPYSQFCVVSLSFHCQGVVAHFLALLARVLGLREVALEHFAHAIDRQEQLALAPQCVRTRYELAHMLSESSELRDRERAQGLLERVRDDACQLTMAPLRAAADKLLEQLARSFDGASARV
jgi:DNA-binding winged helix-turn-helix (wHTH) protein